jgi:hypothetical protein
MNLAIVAENSSAAGRSRVVRCGTYNLGYKVLKSKPREFSSVGIRGSPDANHFLYRTMRGFSIGAGLRIFEFRSLAAYPDDVTYLSAIR